MAQLVLTLLMSIIVDIHSLWDGHDRLASKPLEKYFMHDIEYKKSELRLYWKFRIKKEESYKSEFYRLDIHKGKQKNYIYLSRSHNVKFTVHLPTLVRDIWLKRGIQCFEWRRFRKWLLRNKLWIRIINLFLCIYVPDSSKKLLEKMLH